MKSPEAEVTIDQGLVQELVSQQHGDLADLPLTELSSGWDNNVWRLGAELLVRLPRRAAAAPLALHEHRWLPRLPLLPLPIPVLYRLGKPSSRYPWSWSIVPWIGGTPGDVAVVTEPADAAQRLAGFLWALHKEAPPDAPANPYRGISIAARTATFNERIDNLAAECDVAAAHNIWQDAVTAQPWSDPPVWLHGDLHPANLLIDAGTLSGVIDFGDLCSGDPATDLAAAWMLLPTPQVEIFMAAYGRLDPDLHKRTLGWAVLFALMLLEIGLSDQGRNSYATIGRATLDRLSSHTS